MYTRNLFSLPDGSADSQHTAVSQARASPRERHRALSWGDHHKAAACHGPQPSSAPHSHQPLHVYLMCDLDKVISKLELFFPYLTSIQSRNILKQIKCVFKNVFKNIISYFQIFQPSVCVQCVDQLQKKYCLIDSFKISCFLLDQHYITERYLMCGLVVELYFC